MHRFALLAVLLLLVASSGVSAQITIAPTALFIDEQSRFGSMLAVNNTEQTQEVSVEFDFGYPATDEQGNVRMVYDDEQAASRYSMADWAQVFPQNFVLEPDERQTIRVQARPPGELQDGMYWSRIRVSANPESPAIEEETQDGIQAQVTFRFEQVTAGFYKHGDVSTGLDIRQVRTETADGMLTVLVDAARRGNAPFIGTLSAEVFDSQGRQVARESTTTNIYFEGTRRIQVPVEDLDPGEYELQVRFETERGDVDSADLVQTDPITEVTTFRID